MLYRLLARALAALLAVGLLAGQSHAAPSAPPSPAPSPSPMVLTLAQSLDMGYRQSPLIPESEELVVQAVATYQQLWSQKNVTLGVTTQSAIQPASEASFLGRTLTLTTIFSNQISVGFKNLLTTFGNVESQIAAAFVQIDVQAVGVEVTRAQLGLSVKQAFFERMKADGSVAVAQDNLEVSQQSLDDTRKQFLQGQKARYDVLQAELSVYQAVEQLQQATNAVASTTAGFYTVLNQDPRPPLILVTPPPIQVSPDIQLDDLVDAGLRHRPEMAQLDRSLEAARLLVKAAKNSSNASITLGLNYNTTTGTVLGVNNQVIMGIGFNWPLFDGGLRAAKVMNAQSQLRALEASGVDLRQQIRLQIEQAWLSLQLSAANLATAIKRAATADEFLDMARTRFNNGLATSLDVQQAIEQKNVADQQVVVADADRNEAFAQLERAIGMDFPDRRLDVASTRTIPQPEGAPGQ